MPETMSRVPAIETGTIAVETEEALDLALS
jgi:hypothetical protein